MNLYEFKAVELSFVVASKTEEKARALILNSHLSKVASKGGDLKSKILAQNVSEKESILMIFDN